jgi:hypothetical protein
VETVAETSADAASLASCLTLWGTSSASDRTKSARSEATRAAASADEAAASAKAAMAAAALRDGRVVVDLVRADGRRRAGRGEEDPAAAAAGEGDEAVHPWSSRSPRDRVSWGGRVERYGGERVACRVSILLWERAAAAVVLRASPV